jgi:hypothetical protein
LTATSSSSAADLAPGADIQDVPSEPSNLSRQAASCGKKRRHPTRASARRARRLAPARGLSIYRCPICGDYHLTSTPRPWSESSDPEAREARLSR